MTVLTTQSLDEAVTQYDTNGKQTYFEYGFELISGTTIAVFLKNKRIFNFEQRAKGIIIKPAPTGRLVIVRQLEITQERDFEAFDSFNAEWTEAAMDKLILLKQEAAEYRAFMNLTAAHYTSFVKITNDKGTDADIYLWNGRNDEGVPIPPTPPPPDPANPPPESGLSDDFTQYDEILDWQTTPNPPFNDATIEIIVYPNGELDGITFNTNNGNSYQNFPQQWNIAEPLVDDSANYEARLTWLSGWRKFYYRDEDQTIKWVIVATAGASRRDSSPWQDLSVRRRYRFTHSDSTGSTDRLWNYEGSCQLEIREVGKPETVKIKRMDMRLLIQT